ncbi:MAG: ribosomal RNA adenine dimethylase domain-containing protein [Candidatus Wallbacteria bacterium]|nr:ribosomal RNA adenine dimethylase domain-containing protein [Candidatus Wallbacteria bacterium]
MWAFFKQFLKNCRDTGAVSPSSRELADLVTSSAELESAGTVVEFGTGTGVFTECIQRKINPGALFFALEINPYFYQKTRERCPDCCVYCDSAAHVSNYLEKHGLKECDCIVSGLPWTAFGRKLQEQLLNATVAALKPAGRFVTFSYLPFHLMPAGTRFREMLCEKFNTVERSRVVWRNFPPAFVYVCRK